ncbi:cache domain-containing protein [Microvirga sp. 17 mud 1-3]|uniref:cache domain-containing protein n=1 Tax=Microvirga sp. 17 mud 1-3 TaxID=2082949 RepID=UPI000D6D370A|nr:cache domain-containing protein [Microvirga sp. 17 mud 1-3]AWM86807.1 hypothetical protein C4E04_08770 [Microvirga sp. 17 mud 1-3]
MKRSSSLYLYLLAAVVVLGILAISSRSIYEDRESAWREAEKSSHNLLKTLSRDIASRINLVDLSLRGAIEGLRTPEFQKLPPDIQHGRLFDRAATVSFTGTFFVLDANGDLVADGGSIIAPRPWNSAGREYFQVHKTNRLTGLYLGHPHKSTAANDDLSIILSRRISGRNGEFGGVVAARISLSGLHDLLKSLDLGLNGSVSLFRADGILLMRHPYDADKIGRDLSDAPTVKRFIREDSGQFEGTAALDGVRRFYTFERVDHFPLVLSVALSVDEIVAPWRRKALVLGLVTGVLCSAVVGLLVVFRRELQRRTRAEAELSRLARTYLDGIAQSPRL